MPVDHLEEKAKDEGWDADNGKDEMAKKEMSREMLWEAAWEFKISDERDVAAELVEDWQGGAEEVSSIEEKGKRWKQKVDKKVKGIVGYLDPFLISSIVFSLELYAWDVRAKYVNQGARP